MARFLNVEEDEWDRLIDDKLRDINDENKEDYIPDTLPSNVGKDKIKYSIKTNKKEIE